MTEKLFWKDPYVKHFEARVLNIDGKKVMLDLTYFYPEGGGQVGDQGWMNGIDVIDTAYEGNAIIHILKSDPTFAKDNSVECKLNWDRRYQIMKLHSASHIMEYFLFQVVGRLDRLGSNVNERRDSSTYAYPQKLDNEKLSEVNELVNKFILEGHEITTWSSEKDPEYRFWKCGEIEEACGGTHPRNTMEIGMLKLKRENPGRGKERVITKLVI